MERNCWAYRSFSGYSLWNDGKDFNSVRAEYKEKHDAKFDKVIQEILRALLHSGERIVTGTLLFKGYKAKRYRARQSLNRENT